MPSGFDASADTRCVLSVLLSETSYDEFTARMVIWGIG